MNSVNVALTRQALIHSLHHARGNLRHANSTHTLRALTSSRVLVSYGNNHTIRALNANAREHARHASSLTRRQTMRRLHQSRVTIKHRVTPTTLSRFGENTVSLQHVRHLIRNHSAASTHVRQHPHHAINERHQALSHRLSKRHRTKTPRTREINIILTTGARQATNSIRPLVTERKQSTARRVIKQTQRLRDAHNAQSIHNAHATPSNPVPARLKRLSLPPACVALTLRTR